MIAGTKILLIGRFWQGSTDSGILHGLIKAGATVQTIDTRHATGTPTKGRIGKMLYKAHEKFALKGLSLEIIRQLKLFKPDYFMTIKRTELTPLQHEECKSLGVSTVIFYPDFHFDYRTVDIKSLEHFDYIFTTKSFHVNYLRENFTDSEIHFLHHGYNSLVHNPIYQNVNENDFLHEISYIGNHNYYKAQWMNNLIDATGDSYLSIMGPNWNEANDKIKSHWQPGEIRNMLFTQNIQLSNQHQCIRPQTEQNLHETGLPV